ncbi:DUF5719 family protein [Planococcus sp. APC 4015]|nr:DUF5719 family protein [Planococcus sp. APC 4015]
MSDRRVFRWASTSARMLVGSVVAIGAVVAVVTAVSIPWPTLAREPVAVVATPAPASTVLSCDGGLLVAGRDLTEAGALQQAAPQTVVIGAAPDAPVPDSQALSSADVPGADGPTVVTAEPSTTGRTDLAAAGSATAASDDLVGFSASACRPPLMDSWLVSGSATTGSADFILLSNPGAVAATVQLTVHGATGAQTPPGGADLIVPAGTQRVIPLAGLARGELSPVIRVTSVGAPVQAAIQSSLTRVLEPGGVDQAGAVTAASEVQTIAGVVVTEVSAGGSAATVVRVLSPAGDTDATVTVRDVVGGASALAPITVPLAAGIPTEIGLNGLEVGEYVIDVEASLPIVSGVWQTSGTGEGSDFAWLLPSPAISVPTLLAVPDGPTATLTLVNSGDTATAVTVSDADGSDAVTVDLSPGGATRFDVSARQGYLLDSAGVPVLAAVTMSGDGALAGFPIWPADAAAPAITVYP